MQNSAKVYTTRSVRRKIIEAVEVFIVIIISSLANRQVRPLYQNSDSSNIHGGYRSS